MVAFGLAALQQPASAATPEIWLVPNSGTSDYAALFQGNAPWNSSAQSVSVFGISADMASRAPLAELGQIVARLREKEISLSVGILPLSGPDREDEHQCGYHVEGYSAPFQSASLARRIRDIGGVPASFVMDEPLFFGHLYSGQRACRASVVAVAEDAGRKVASLRSVFPSVAIGDTEPLSAFETKAGLDILREWLDAFKIATGTPLDFFFADVDWHRSWQATMTQVAKVVHAGGVRFGVIYNGSDRTLRDDVWIAEATSHIQATEQLLIPDLVSFQTWVARPSRVLPENDPNSLTGLVKSYVEWRRARGAE